MVDCDLEATLNLWVPIHSGGVATRIASHFATRLMSQSDALHSAWGSVLTRSTPGRIPRLLPAGWRRRLSTAWLGSGRLRS